MTYDISEGKQLIQTVMQYALSIRPSMNFLLEFCAKAEDNTVWKKIAGLDFDKDLAQLEQWLQKTLHHNPPPGNILAYWFGVYHPVLNDGQTTCAMYLSGSPRFDPVDPSAAWAELRDDTYLPDGCYAQSLVLDQLYYLTRQEALAELGDNILCLGYACLAVHSAFRQLGTPHLASPEGECPVAVGYDDGEYLFIPTRHA